MACFMGGEKEKKNLVACFEGMLMKAL